MAQKLSPIAKMNKNAYKREYAKNNYDQLRIELPKGTKDVWKEHAREMGLPLKQFIVKAVEEYIANHKEV